MTNASDMWNNLPSEDRARLNGILIQRQIQDVQLEINRAVAAHKAHIAKARKHLKNLGESYEKWERENGFGE